MSRYNRQTIIIGALSGLVVVLLVTIMNRPGPPLDNIKPEAKSQPSVNIPNKLIQEKTIPVAPIPDVPIETKPQPSSKTADNIAHPNPILDNVRRNGMLVLPDKEALKAMDADALFQTYHSYIDNTDTLCNRKLRMGKLGDGGWEVCDDEKYRPSQNCLVYSFGINNDFSFDDDVSRVYNCSVVSFDPSMKQESHQRSPLVYFLKMGLAEKDFEDRRKWQLRTLGSFLKKFNHTNRVIDVLKMDVESAEWSALPEMVSSGTLRQAKQLLLEYHGRWYDKATLLSKLIVLKDIYDIGFRKFYVHKNQYCGYGSKLYPGPRTSCYEVHYVNVNLE